MNTNDLEKDIAQLISSYRQGELFFSLDEDHVRRWANQFEEDERCIVLTETKNLLLNNYIAKQEIENYFESIWVTPNVMGDGSYSYINNIQFLNIQQKGTSQKRLLDLINQFYQTKKGVGINTTPNANIKKYIYLDDCMYTGNRVRHDIKDWIDRGEYNKNTELDIIFLGVYTGNLEYVKNYINEICEPKGINVNIFTKKTYNNSLLIQPYDIIWPMEIEGNTYVDAYMQELEEEKERKGKGGLGYRKAFNNHIESKLFTSTHNRIIFEKALMKAGAYICSLPENRNDYIRPMGYSYNISLGYGAFFVTCYNISNNCPLAFWWGDPFVDNTSTLGRWYPLLPRLIN